MEESMSHDEKRDLGRRLWKLCQQYADAPECSAERARITSEKREAAKQLAQEIRQSPFFVEAQQAASNALQSREDAAARACILPPGTSEAWIGPQSA